MEILHLSGTSAQTPSLFLSKCISLGNVISALINLIIYILNDSLPPLPVSYGRFVDLATRNALLYSKCFSATIFFFKLQLLESVAHWQHIHGGERQQTKLLASLGQIEINYQCVFSARLYRAVYCFFSAGFKHAGLFACNGDTS